ncbi:MAG: BolA/IbaG family iron-sulfur metabolism protein [Endozoicomonadaceae bacterium]|nr:BolA/IbaG family iron-sulfur metabolism protein [Endozoicomonadaceae bacterium]
MLRAICQWNSNNMTSDELQLFLEKKIPQARIILTGESCHLTLTVIDRSFQNQSALQRQKAIYAHLNSLIAEGCIHAVSMQLFTPDEWEKRDTE